MLCTLSGNPCISAAHAHVHGFPDRSPEIRSSSASWRRRTSGAARELVFCSTAMQTNCIYICMHSLAITTMRAEGRHDSPPRRAPSPRHYQCPSPSCPLTHPTRTAPPQHAFTNSMPPIDLSCTHACDALVRAVAIPTDAVPSQMQAGCADADAAPKK